LRHPLEYNDTKMVHIMKYYIITKRKLYLCMFILIAAILALMLFYLSIDPVPAAKIVMGAKLYSQDHQSDGEPSALVKANPEKYFRPSKLLILNNKEINHDSLFQFQDIPPEHIKMPSKYLSSPEDTILNYFSIIREGENLTDDKSGGCGTIGDAKLPFPTAYSFFSQDYKNRINYNQYLKSFEGIGHTNLIKLKDLPPDKAHPDKMRYFVEVETLEGSDKGVTYFAYYFGFIYIEKLADSFLITDIQLTGEDFLCAPYHGWYHDAETNVSTRYGEWCKMIKKQYPVKESGYVKKIYFEGTDGSNYMIEFVHLTNDTDIEVAQYKQSIEGPWTTIYLNPVECVEDKQ